MQKLCLRMFKVIKKLTKSEIKDYGVEFAEEWNACNSEYDITRALVTKKEIVTEKVIGKGYRALPTYYPIYLRSLD